MWQTQISPAEWGAADMAISVKISDGRVVWLYGDTMSKNNGFVNSSAIVQSGSLLHVSHQGAQVFPKGRTEEFMGYKTVYWIETARSTEDNKIIATVAETRIGTKSVWDFKREHNYSHEALLEVTASGDVNFVKWLSRVKPPKLNNELITFDAQNRNHFAYAKQEHKHFILASGETLLTYSQNWDNIPNNDFKRTATGEIDWAAYRPIFTTKPLKDAFVN